MVLSTARLGSDRWTGQDDHASEDVFAPFCKSMLLNVAVRDERSLQHLPAGREARLRARFTIYSRTGKAWITMNFAAAL